VNRLTILILLIFLLNNCSFNENSRIWNEKEKTSKNQNTVKKIFTKNKKNTIEFNKDLKLDFTKIETNNKVIDNKNNYGSQNYSGPIDKIANYNFSKIENINKLNFKPIFLNDGLIFFDKKGSIIRYDDSQKILWKKNYYSKSEIKLKPQLNFILDGENLIVIDNIAKYYSLNINSGKLNWSKNSIYPFNSEIKKINNKIFAIDFKNTLRCFYINDGSECWNVQTEDSFTISDTRFSLIIIDNMVIFSSSIGDITAINIETGLITWQLPTQSNDIINETYNFKISQLVSDDESIFFSNNKNEFFSIDVKTGTKNWTNEINSNLTPIIIGNLIFTVSNDGFLYVVEKNKGNIIRITDLYGNYKIKKRKNVKPIGFAIGNSKLYLTNTDGNMIIADLNLGNVVNVKKVDGNFVSKPFIFNQNLFIIRNGSIIRYN
jgi:outer membrane protein assembly factor BamB